jgi:hypothetical protein
MNDDQTNGRDEDKNEQDGTQAQDASAAEKKSEVSIYVVKTTIAAEGDGEDKVTFSVGVNGHTHVIDGNRAAALEEIGEILDSLD